MRVAVIGTGQISAEHLRFLQMRTDVSLMAVCDLSRIAAEYHAEQFGAEAAYTDHQEMLAATQPDVAHILTPAVSHPALIRDCLEAGAHVICEKPIAPTRPELEELIAIARQRERWLIEDHNYRFNDTVQEVEQLVASGALGEVREVEIRMALPIRGGRYGDANLPHSSHRMPAGVIHEFITHLTYLLLRFLPEYDDVIAAWRNHGGDDLFTYDDLDALIIGNMAHGRIRFTCHAGPDQFSLTVRGSKGLASTDLFHPCLVRTIPRSAGKQLSPIVNYFCGGWRMLHGSAGNFRRKLLQQTPYEGLHTFLGMTYHALVDGGQPPVTYEQMRATSHLIDAMVSKAARV